MTRKKSLVVSFMGLALIALSVLVSFFSGSSEILCDDLIVG